MRIVIIGGGSAGATAAQFARKQSRDAEIIVIERGHYPEYSRCGLPHALTGEIPQFDDLVEFSSEWFQRNKIDLRLSSEVAHVDASHRTIEIIGPAGRTAEPYDSLVFATGATPSVPKIEGVLDKNQLRAGVFQFKGMDDARSLRQWCDKAKRNVLVVGAGLIGLEVAESLRHLGHEVVVVEYLDSILPTMIDADMTDPIVSAASNMGIRIMTSSAVEALIRKDTIESAKVTSCKDSGSTVLKCDTVILATGQRPDNSLAQSIGCITGRAGHIRVNDRCETNLKGVFGVGDCTEYLDFITGNALLVGLGTLAVKMGEIGGKNAAGGDAHLPKGFLNARVTRLFGMQIAATGPLSTALADASMKSIQSRTKGSTLPAYFPGGKDLLVKLIASADDGRLLSGQIIGEREAAMRIDIISALIMGGLGARDLAQLENAYAPPVAPCVDVLTAAAQAIMIKMERARMV